MVARERADGGGIVRELGMDMSTVLCLRQIADKDWRLLYSEGTLLRVTWQPGWEGRLGENGA